MQYNSEKKMKLMIDLELFSEAQDERELCMISSKIWCFVLFFFCKKYLDLSYFFAIRIKGLKHLLVQSLDSFPTCLRRTIDFIGLVNKQYMKRNLIRA